MVYTYPRPRLPKEFEDQHGDPVSSGQGLAVCETASSYCPRNPEGSVLYGVVAAQLNAFLERQRSRDRHVPRFVERELRSFLDCGILARGFLRVHCDACGKDRLVAYSCKGRGFCPSCGGRRMADTAAHLVDRVFPEVPVRQWVLSVHFRLRYRLAYDARLLTEVLRIFVQAVFASLRRRAGFRAGDRTIRCGAVTFVQRFGDALNLNVHFHMLALDGVYAESKRGHIRFHVAPPPSDAEVARLARRLHHRVGRLLERCGLGPQSDPDEVDTLLNDQPLLAELYGASVSGRVATGRRAGHRLAKVGGQVDAEDLPAPSGPRCATISGFSVHANVSVPAHDRMRLERLCRYAGRPPLATDRLSMLPDGRLLYRLKRRWRDGTSHIIFEPLDLVAKLAVLVPPPRFNLVRYHGVLAPSAGWRALLVPPGPETDYPQSHPRCEVGRPVSDSGPESPKPKGNGRVRNYSWALLLRRVFAVNVLECPECHGRMRIVAAIQAPEAICKILQCLGLPARPPPMAGPLPDSETEELYL